jgi:hypothetical protein
MIDLYASQGWPLNRVSPITGRQYARSTCMSPETFHKLKMPSNSNPRRRSHFGPPKIAINNLDRSQHESVKQYNLDVAG